MNKIDKNNSSFWDTRINYVKNNQRRIEWLNSAKNILSRYRNEAFTAEHHNYYKKNKGYNLLYRNVKTRMSYLVPFVPTISVDTMDQQTDNVVLRTSAFLLESIARKLFSNDKFDSLIQSKKLDAELQGDSGVIWFRYSIKEEMKISETQIINEVGEQVIVEQEHMEEIEELEYDSVSPVDFFTNTARNEEEIEWVARRFYMNKENFKQRFKDVDENDYIFSTAHEESENSYDGYNDNINESSDPKIEVFEIWDRVQRKIIFFSKPSAYKAKNNNNDLIEIIDNPYKDIDFPCILPLKYDEFTDSTIPVPRHSQYIYQYEAIDRIYKQIDDKIASIRLIALGDDRLNLSDIFDKNNNEAIQPVKVPQELYEKGGLQNMISWYSAQPASDIIATLLNLQNIISEQIQMGIGIPEILEGTTSQQEAYGTNRIKGSFGTQRIQDDQRKIIKFIEKNVKLGLSIICNDFSDESIMKLGGLKMINQGILLQSIKLLRNESTRNVNITIATEESRSYVDENYKVQIQDLSTQTANNINTWVNVLGVAPEFAQVAKQMILQPYKASRVGRQFEIELEANLDNAIKIMQQKQSQAPQPPQPDITVMSKAQADNQTKIQIKQMELQNKSQELQAKTQSENIDQNVTEQNNLAKQALEQSKIVLDNRKLDAEIYLKQQELLRDKNIDSNLGGSVFY